MRLEEASFLQGSTLWMAGGKEDRVGRKEINLGYEKEGQKETQPQLSKHGTVEVKTDVVKGKEKS